MLFTYIAIDRAGVTQKGEREAEDEKALARTLRLDGMLLSTAKKKGAGLSALPSFSLSHVSLVERMMFARNLAVMVGAGLSMTRALEAIHEQAANKKFKIIIQNISKSITGGRSFSQALAPEKEIFGDFFVSMVEAGELSGKLEGTLKLLARQMKRDHTLRSKVKSAMMYPAVVVCALLGIGALMLIYVVPTLTQTFEELEIPLPATTKFIIFFSNSVLSYGVYMGAGLLLLIALLARVVKSSKGQFVFDNLILKVPVIGPLIKNLNIARMARTLSSLISAGLSITKALSVSAHVVGNARFRASLEDATREIEKGKTLSQIFARYPDLYSPVVIQMISVGEETGSLSRMLVRLALFFEEEVQSVTRNLSSIIEPVLMVAIGILVGFFAISMIQPLYSSLAGL